MTLLKEKVLRFCSKGRNKSIMWVRASPGFDSTLWSIFFFFQYSTWKSVKRGRGTASDGKPALYWSVFWSYMAKWEPMNSNVNRCCLFFIKFEVTLKHPAPDLWLWITWAEGYLTFKFRGCSQSTRLITWLYSQCCIRSPRAAGIDPSIGLK